MERELTTLPIDKLTLIKLEKAGFSVIGDVVDFKAFELSKGWRILESKTEKMYNLNNISFN